MKYYTNWKKIRIMNKERRVDIISQTSHPIPLFDLLLSQLPTRFIFLLPPPLYVFSFTQFPVLLEFPIYNPWKSKGYYQGVSVWRPGLASKYIRYEVRSIWLKIVQSFFWFEKYCFLLFVSRFINSRKSND